MKAIFVNRFFHPDPAPTALYAADVAFDWAACGHEVHAIAGRGGYDDAARRYPADETVAGVRIHRVWTSGLGRRSIATRMVDYAAFYLLAGWRLWRLARRGDVLVVKTDPPLMSVVGALVAGSRGARLVNWLQDVFPEVAIEARVGLPPGTAAPLRRLRDWSLRRATLNVVLGERMARTLAARALDAPVHIVPNWADGARLAAPAAAAHALRSEWGFGDRFVVGYCGNLGRAHDVGTILEAARLLSAREDIVFSFVGGGHGFGQVRAAALRNVAVRGHVAQERLAATLAACDVHLVTLLPRFEGLIVPSKFYGVAAAARPAIFVGDPDGELARIIAHHACGVAVASGDADGLARAIVELREADERRGTLGANARAAFQAEWDRPVALRRWRGVLALARSAPSKGRYSRNAADNVSI